MIDFGPRNRGFYTGLIELPKIHRISKGMSGLWSSAEALLIEKCQKPPCSIEDPWGRRFWIFSNRIVCGDFITKFVDIKTFTQRPYGRKRFPGLLSKSIECRINALYLQTIFSAIFKAIYTYSAVQRYVYVLLPRCWLLRNNPARFLSNSIVIYVHVVQFLNQYLSRVATWWSLCVLYCKKYRLMFLDQPKSIITHENR